MTLTLARAVIRTLPTINSMPHPQAIPGNANDFKRATIKHTGTTLCHYVIGGGRNKKPYQIYWCETPRVFDK